MADERILVAEDHPASQQVATAVIENLGFDAHVVANGAEAVHVAAPGRYVAILMDCQLPLLNGFEATCEIRRLQGRAGHTPIIAVTVESSESVQERCRAAGMDDFLAKPLSRQSLAATLERWAPGAGRTARADSDELSPSRRSQSRRPLPPPTDRPVLDAAVINEIDQIGRAAGVNLVGQLATMFLSDADAAVSEMRRAFMVDDAAALARVVHALGGASANLGATNLARLCGDWEAAIVPGEVLGDRSAMDAVEIALALVRPALEPYRLSS